MEKLNFNQIMDVLKEKIGNIHDFAYNDFDEEELGLGEIKEVHQEGGEDQGSHWESVKHFKNHDVFIKVTGWYSSYDGTDFYGWDNCIEVYPQQKIITVYE